VVACTIECSLKRLLNLNISNLDSPREVDVYSTRSQQQLNKKKQNPQNKTATFVSTKTVDKHQINLSKQTTQKKNSSNQQKHQTH
jgi:hypothetical protein